MTASAGPGGRSVACADVILAAPLASTTRSTMASTIAPPTWNDGLEQAGREALLRVGHTVGRGQA